MRFPMQASLVLAVVGLIVAGCDTPATSVGAGGPSMEQLAAKLQGKEPEKPAAPPATPEPVPAADTPSAPANDGGRGGAADGGRGGADPSEVPDDAKRASDRGTPATRRGYLGAIVGANRNVREALSDVSWQKSVQLFEAEMGRKPRDTNEFMERIQREGTPLPMIDPANTYLYVPEDGQFGTLYQVPRETMEGERRGG